MASTASTGNPEAIMAAQPGDTDTLAAQALSRANDAMAPAAGQESPIAKENQQMDTGVEDSDESFNLSESPTKPSQAPVIVPSSDFVTPRSSLTPTRGNPSQGQGTTDRPRNSSRGKAPGKFAKTIAGLVLHRRDSPSSLKRGASA